MELLKVYMLVLSRKILKKYIINTALLSIMLFISCVNSGKKNHIPIALKQEKVITKKKIEVPKLLPQKKIIKDVINLKNAEKFFLDYGKKNPETKLILKTRLGNMHITLFKETPIHRASFIYLIKNGYYNKTCFHRIVKDFIIQGGWSDTDIIQEYRDQLNNYKIPSEFRKGIIHKRGALSATRRWVDNPSKLSSPFEFFIMQTSLDCSHLNFEHTVFGQVTSGFDVIDKISNVTLDGRSEWPEVDVNIEFEILK